MSSSPVTKGTRSESLGSDPHAFLEGTGRERETKTVAHVSNAVGAGGVEIAESALGFDNQRCGFPAHDFAVALRIADVNQQLDVARQVQVAGWQIGELHRALLPARLQLAQRHAGANDEILHVAGVNARGDFQEARLPALPLPSVGWGGLEGERLVAVPDFPKHVEVVGA